MSDFLEMAGDTTMSMGLWMGGLRADIPVQPQRSTTDRSLMEDVRELQHHIERLTLMNQALWELLRERLKLTDADLERMAQEVDLRDGVADGRMTTTALRCPQCNRVSSSKHWKCLYCGVLFEKPAMG